MSGEAEVSWQMVGTIVTAAGVAALTILRWRDRDVKAITERIEARLTADFKVRFEELQKRISDLEGKVEHLENGSLLATMKAVEIKSTSMEPRTQQLAQEIIDCLKIDPHPPRGV